MNTALKIRRPFILESVFYWMLFELPAPADTKATISRCHLSYKQAVGSATNDGCRERFRYLKVDITVPGHCETWVIPNWYECPLDDPARWIQAIARWIKNPAAKEPTLAVKRRTASRLKHAAKHLNFAA